MVDVQTSKYKKAWSRLSPLELHTFWALGLLYTIWNNEQLQRLHAVYSILHPWITKSVVWQAYCWHLIVAWCSIVYCCIHYQSVLSSEGETHKRQQNAFLKCTSHWHQLHREGHKAEGCASAHPKTHFCIANIGIILQVAKQKWNKPKFIISF